ncbi:hypothetical protein SBDP1_1680001 [Syntrophobacter sp. SbD1]|nr:hypothetical protein SBDP1_1680001 [Syntrophobacter sp. SbD1]
MIIAVDARKLEAMIQLRKVCTDRMSRFSEMTDSTQTRRKCLVTPRYVLVHPANEYLCVCRW